MNGLCNGGPHELNGLHFLLGLGTGLTCHGWVKAQATPKRPVTGRMAD